LSPFQYYDIINHWPNVYFLEVRDCETPFVYDPGWLGEIMDAHTKRIANNYKILLDIPE